jgi:predicted secreted protein
MRNAPAVLAIAACVLLLSSCGGDDAASSTFTTDDFGTTQPLTVGQVAVLALPSNPSTGAGWHRAWTPEASLELMNEYYAPDPQGGVGAGGTQYFVFKAQQPGIVAVTVQYGQWWQGGQTQAPHTITFIISG